MGRIKQWRKMTWALIVWTALTGFFMIAGVNQASGVSAECKNDVTLGTKLCNDAQDAGTAIGVGLLLGLWFVGFIVLSLVWFMSRPKQVVYVERSS
jgi:hypothetical protein